MRSLINAIVVLAISASSAYAQPPQGGHRGNPPPPPTAPAPRTVAPPIVYPFAPLMTPPPGGLTGPSGPDNRAYRPDGRNRGPGYSSGYQPYVYGGGYAYPSVANVPAPAVVPTRATGWLRLAVAPSTAQVLVDGYYVGTVGDLEAKSDLQVAAGVHRIEMRAAMHQALIVDVQIAPNETVTYRGALETIRPLPPAGSANPNAAAAKMYIIPNCYLGNVPPRASRLPASCDVKLVQVIEPK